MNEGSAIQRVMVTGATGFVGRSVIRAMLAKGVTPVCVVRSPDKLFRQHPQVDPDRFAVVVGDLATVACLKEAASSSHACIHLVGIILERRLMGQTFERVHVRGTRNVVDAVQAAGIRRYLHMSALGTRPDAKSDYHQTKWAAEEYVRGSGLDWTMFRPSFIHGPEGEFMQLMKRLICGLMPPVVPYFGTGTAKLQPVSVQDVAHCFVEALGRPETIGQVYPLGGPKTYSWIELYNTCRALMPCARHWKPLVSQPVWAAKAAATMSGPVMAALELLPKLNLGLFRFDRGQVQMSQEDAVCDHTLAERTFGLRMRSFENELGSYADRIP